MRRVISIIVVAALALCSVMTMAGIANAGTGSITGHVYEEGTTTPVTGATVYAYDWSVDLTVGIPEPAGSGYVQADGSYTISALASGDYRVVAVMEGYFSDYWDSPVTVTEPNAATGIDLAMAVGGAISGYVYQEGTSTPIYPARVIAYNSTNNQMVDDGWTTDNGSYILGNNVGSGDYKVKAEADGYFSEYYDNVTNSGSALLVTVTVPDERQGVNFGLAPGGWISGSVHSDNGTPIYGAKVTAYDFSSGAIVDTAWTTDNGSYVVGNDIDTGDYRVGVDADGYFSEYHDNVTNPTLAAPITITLPDDPSATGIDFILAEGGSITGIVYQDDGATPIYLARVIAYDNVTGLLVDDGWSRPNGSYTIGNNIGNGYYKIKAEALGYYSEYYDNVTDLALATAVQVTIPYATPDKDFTLTPQTLVFSSVSANVAGENTATITWITDQAGSSLVEYGLTDTYGSASTLSENLTTSHTVDLTGLTRGTTYHYRAVSADASHHEGRSGDFTFTTPDLTAPAISGVTAIDITATGATITWTTDEPATSQMEYGTSAPGYSTTTDEDVTLVTAHSVILTGLTSGTTYHYLVKSRDTMGSGLWASSEDYTFATLDITAPAISQVAASGITQTGGTITWTTDEATTSQVEYGPTDQYGSATTLDAALVTSHSVNLTGLTASTTYHYRVKSKDASNNETQSGDNTFTTSAAPAVDTTPPTTPAVTDDGASITSLTQLHATWTSSDPESGIVEYQYAIGTSAGGNDVVDWTSAGTATSTTKTGLSLTAGTTYYFSVKAKNGQGLWSAIGTSDGISAQEQPAPEEPSDGGGLPVWAWVIIGLAGGAAIGGVAYWLSRGPSKKQK